MLKPRPNLQDRDQKYRTTTGVTLNNASDYLTDGLYQTPNPHPNPNPLVR